jgi:hypothetical protein
MNLYRQTIILFGVVLPVLIAAVLSASVIFDEIQNDRFLRQQAAELQGIRAKPAGRLEIEAQVTRQRAHLERWNQQLSQETASAVATNLRQIMDRLPARKSSKPHSNGPQPTAASARSPPRSPRRSASRSAAPSAPCSAHSSNSKPACRISNSRNCAWTPSRTSLAHQLPSHLHRMGKLINIKPGHPDPSLLQSAVRACVSKVTLAMVLGSSAFAQSAASFEAKPQPAKTPQATEQTAAVPAPTDAAVNSTPSRYVGETDLDAYVASLTATFAMRGRATDPFGQIQDPDARPIVKVSATKKPGRVTTVQAVPLSDIIQRIKVTTIAAGEKRFLVGMRSFRLGDRLALVFRGKTIDLEITSVQSHQIDFRNVATGETASLKMTLMPVGMVPGKKNIMVPGMVPDRPDAPLQLDELNP